MCAEAGAYGLDIALEFIPGTGFPDLPTTTAIVNAIGQIRQVVSVNDAQATGARRYLVIAPQVNGKPGAVVQVQAL